MTGDRCGVERPGGPLAIGNQTPQEPRCQLAAGHDGEHLATVLDSDDNAITERWWT